MNDSKWLKLQTAILSIPKFEPIYGVQLLTDEIEHSPYLKHRRFRFMEIGNLYMKIGNTPPPPFFNIEWMAIQPLDKIP